ncbi:synaptotagmin-15-like isoform X1 [Octopus vulgaris]|uniref:Synaptotagmin-15-like isoform X1 n=1 Tax=Octopus vulgaris TaxID=6645 RepID=A0AA36BJA4_OCTVU|nr:synaptotagmin-15-like isoform X1 [Octopus vulgaris]
MYSKKRSSTQNYDEIETDNNAAPLSDTPFCSTTSINTKQIPFTVPPHGTPQVSRRSSRSLGEEHPAGYGSEPSSPALKRPSVEIPGAYELGAIDPSLYKIVDEDEDYDMSDDHIGRLWFTVEYERETEKLLVTLIKAKNLPSRTMSSSNGCDPFVRIYLMPDERRYLQSKLRKKTCNPKFEESYIFQVSHKSFDDRILKFTMFDVDRHRRHNVIGHALFPLKEYDCENNERMVIWRDLEKEVSESTSDKGEIFIALSYNSHLERLTTAIFEARDLKKTDGNTNVGMDSYVKVCLLIQNKIVKSKKTAIVKRTIDPNFSESFTFKLSSSSLDTASISVSTMQHFTGAKDKMIGRVVLGSFMFARGRELEHWNEMLSSQRDQISYWHSLT